MKHGPVYADDRRLRGKPHTSMTLVTVAIGVWVFFSTAIVPLAAQTLPARSGPAEPSAQRAFLDVRINGVADGQSLVLVRSDDLLMLVADLKTFGVHDAGGTIEQTPAGAYVSLKSLAPVVLYTYKEAELRVDLIVDPKYLEHAIVNVDEGGPITRITPAKRSAFFNYSVQAAPAGLATSGEANVAVNGAVFSSLIQHAPDGALTAGQTSLTFDSPRMSRRIIVGETTLQGGGRFDGTARVAGFSISRDFDLDPNLIRTQDGAISGVVSTPSTAQIYVNGVLARTELLNPGTFTFANLPLTGGANATTVVLKDAFGHESTVAQTLYATPSLLRHGLLSYDVGIGRISAGTTTAPPSLASLAYVKAGLTPAFSASATVEESRSTQGAAAEFVTASSRFGEVAMSGALSRGIAQPSSLAGVQLVSLDQNLATTPPLTAAVAAPLPASTPVTALPPPAPSALAPAGTTLRGDAIAGSYTYQTPRASIGFSLAYQSPYYGTLSQPVLSDRTTYDRRISASLPLGKRTLVLTDSYEIYRDEPSIHEMLASSQLPTGHLGALSVAGGRGVLAGHAVPIIRLSYNALVRGSTNVTVSSDSSEAGDVAGFSISHQEAARSGLSYTLGETQTNGILDRNFEATLLTPVAGFDLFADQSTGTTSGTFTVNGAIAAVGHTVALTQPITSAFALIDLDGVSGVRTNVNNQLDGRTDRNGMLFATNLFAYQNNAISVVGTDAPSDVLIDVDRKVIAPSYKGGVLVSFAAKRVRSYVGKLVVRSPRGEAVPAYGRITLGDPTAGFTSDIGTDGGFYFEGAQPGTYPAQIAYKGGTCRFTITLPKSAKAVTTLGTIACEAGRSL